MTWRSGKRFWDLLGDGASRTGSFWRALWDVGLEISTHKRFGNCGAARPRKIAHLALVWGFVGAAVTSGLIIVALYILKTPMPLGLDHPFKVLGNVSAVLLVLGGGWLLYNRLSDEDGTRAGKPTAFDNFFFGIVLLVIGTGVLVEAGRFWFEPSVAVALYVVHLAAVSTLFYSFPYSKFAHLMYRTLAMVHERMTAPVARVAENETKTLSRSES
jgi:quinone-modifying oxidoreductase subunit QmoC